LPDLPGLARACFEALVFSGSPVQNSAMDGVSASGAISAAVQGVNAGSSIAVSVLRQTESAQAQQIATLFSSIGLGGNVSAFA
jgi:hypothetical protein